MSREEISNFVHKELEKQGESHKITHAEEVEMIRDILDQEDRDKDGKVSRAEFAGLAHEEF